MYQLLVCRVTARSEEVWKGRLCVSEDSKASDTSLIYLALDDAWVHLLEKPSSMTEQLACDSIHRGLA